MGNGLLVALTDNVQVPDYSAVVTVLTDSFTTTAVKDILVAGVTAAVGFCLFWFAIRKISGMFMRAFKKGKLRL